MQVPRHVVSDFRFPKRKTLGKLSALAAAPLFGNVSALRAQVTARRVALIIGNSAYPRAALANPSHDATDLAANLKKLGFTVILQLDSSRQQMVESIQAFCKTVAATQSVALFYFAGHGMQIDWQNYLLPVDIDLTRAEDIERQSIDLSGLIAGLGRSGGPTSILILDACRDNPFGASGKTGAGLSQMDAQSNTILAYATAPGNVASDGEGRNGLYTGKLLDEINRPDSKIEDVFKRVRLSVRQGSQGRQIPWESTSLEEDFYFLPLSDQHPLTQDELDARFAKDHDDWTRAQSVGTAKAIFKYLTDHPNGNFSELAQALLNKLLADQGEHRITTQTSAANPYSKGSAEAGSISLGDRYVYLLIDRLTKKERSFVQRVTRLTNDTVEYNHGKFKTDLLGNPIIDSDGAQYDDNQLFASEYEIGKEWVTRFGYTSPDGYKDVIRLTCRVVARETIEVPAGQFNTFRVNVEGWRLYKPSRRRRNYWIAPGTVPRFIALESVNVDHKGAVVKDERRELLSFSRT